MKKAAEQTTATQEVPQINGSDLQLAIPAERHKEFTDWLNQLIPVVHTITEAGGKLTVRFQNLTLTADWTEHLAIYLSTLFLAGFSPTGTATDISEAAKKFTRHTDLVFTASKFTGSIDRFLLEVKKAKPHPVSVRGRKTVSPSVKWILSGLIRGKVAEAPSHQAATTTNIAL